jgi:hypothetical protein
VLNALGAAPVPDELRGEAAIRAQFRAGLTAPGAPVTRKPGRHAAARRRRRKPATRPGGTRPGGRLGGAGPLALVGGAALAVIAAASAYMGILPAPVQRIAHLAIAAPSPRTADRGTTAPGTELHSASPVPPSSVRPSTTSAATPSHSPSAKRRNESCEAFWQALQHQSPGQQAPWESPMYQRLSGDAGGPRNVYSYCYQVWSGPNSGARQFPREYAKLPAYPPYFPQPGAGNDGTGNDGPQPPGSGDNPNGTTNGSGPTPATKPGSPAITSPTPGPTEGYQGAGRSASNS